MRPYRALLRGQGVFFAAQSSADCITNMSGFDFSTGTGGKRRPARPDIDYFHLLVQVRIFLHVGS